MADFLPMLAPEEPTHILLTAPEQRADVPGVPGRTWSDRDDDERSRQLAEKDMALAVRYGQILDKHYRGHFFRVEVMSDQGVMKVTHPLLPPTWGIVLKLRDVFSDPTGNLVMRAGGFLLEMFDLPRTSYNRDLYREARRKHYRTMHGIFPLEVDMQTGRTRRLLPDVLTNAMGQF